MSISFFIGGARSGKSISAENYTLNLGNNPFYMATCEILDEEMALRVKRHERTGFDRLPDTVALKSSS